LPPSPLAVMNVSPSSEIPVSKPLTPMSGRLLFPNAVIVWNWMLSFPRVPVTSMKWFAPCVW